MLLARGSSVSRLCWTSMPKIQVLPPALASQIAAGEVVERPASVVKELVENSIDSGASRCTVEVEGGGVVRVSVTDDGCGMSPEDALLCVKRHATSKIRCFEDLNLVTTFGFRGEALPSIAAVSRLRILTRPGDREEGCELQVAGGGEPVTQPMGLPVGTTVEVLDLFYNVPARRKFLRSTGTEAGHVTAVVEAAALAHHELGFTVVRDGRRVREYLSTSSRHERVEQVHGGEPLVRCVGERGPLAIEAYLSRPERARAGSQGLGLYVNGRPIRDRMLAATVAHAYGSVLERGRYPRGVVYLALPQQLLDVNVHPQKAEVRFADPRAVADAVYSLLSRELGRSLSVPRAAASTGSPDTPEPPSRPDAPRARPGPTVASSSSTRGEPANESDAEPRLLQTPTASPRRSPASEAALLAIRDSAAAPIRPRPAVRWSNLRFVAQVRQTFLICEDDEGLYVLDQHAAAERVNFDRLRRQYRREAVTSQSLLFPLTFSVAPGDVELLERYAEQIVAVGLDVRARGTDMVSVHSVPRLLQRASPERLVRDLLGELSRSGGRGFSDAVDLALATMACHGSIRSGDHVSADAAAALLKALDQADFAGHCPHGRPVVTYTSYSELERKVGRR